MPWIKKIEEHWCNRPGPQVIGIAPGSLWRCSDCGAEWVVEAPDPVDAPRYRVVRRVHS